MKKVILFGAAAVFVLSLTSCKKDHTCTCDYAFDGGSETVVYNIPESTKSQAKTICKGQETKDVTDTEYTVSCKVK